MSHFTVGIITRDPHRIDTLLEPYCEGDEYYYEKELYMDRDQYIEEYKINNPDTTLTDDEIYETAKDSYSGVEEDGIYDYYNPDAKWDWYEIGGRWANSLKIPKNCESYDGQHYGESNNPKGKGRYRWVDGAKIKDICWAEMNHLTKEALKSHSDFWDKYVLNGDPDYDPGFAYKREYYLDRYKTKENYIMKQSTFATHSLLIEEDGWYEVGEMGWFGVDDSTADSENDYLTKFYDIINNPTYNDYWFIVVDCHI